MEELGAGLSEVESLPFVFPLEQHEQFDESWRAELEATQLPIPIILCGDFNSTPNSAIVRFVRQGVLSLKGLDTRAMDGQIWENFHPKAQFAKAKLEKDINVSAKPANDLLPYNIKDIVKPSKDNDGHVYHDLKLLSVYPSYCADGARLGSQYHSTFLGQVDWIWYSSQSGLQVLHTVPLPIVQQLQKSSRGLPSALHPSDHLLLGARFFWPRSDPGR